MLLSGLKPVADDTPCISRNVSTRSNRYVEVLDTSLSLMRLQQSIAGQLKKRKELLYNLGAISSYASMLTFFWHGISMLVAKEYPKHTLVAYAALTFFTIVVMALYKWDKKWMRIKTSIGMLVFGVSLLIYLFCWFAY